YAPTLEGDAAMQRLAYLYLAVLAAGCGNNGIGGDGGGQNDMGVPDLAPAAPDMGMVVSGTRLASGRYALAPSDSVTRDDFAIVGDHAMGGVYAFPLAGGASQLVDADAGEGDVALAGKVVFSWHNVDPNTSVGTLNAWTAA